MRDVRLDADGLPGPAVRLLGTLEVCGPDGTRIEIGGSNPRVILAMLVAADGEVVAVDRLIDVLWEESPPASASGTLQTYVSRLRRALHAIGATIVREFAGYRLEIDRGQVDVHRFETLAARGRAALDDGDAISARSMLAESCDLWRGPALVDVRHCEGVSGFARRLDERRLAAVEDRVSADLALGRHDAAVAELEQLVTDHPLRERLWELLALARYRSGMQADALRAITRARDTLVEGLGVEPGVRLRELEVAILAQDPELQLGAGRATPDPRSPRAVLLAATNPSTASVLTDTTRIPPIGRASELAVLHAAFGDALERASAHLAVAEREMERARAALADEPWLIMEQLATAGHPVGTSSIA